MRVLVVHNRYRSAMPSGENRVVDDEVEMLRDAGVNVETFFRNSDDIADFSPLQRATLAISPTYNVEAVRAFRRVIADRRPDIVHLHNPFPLISPWVVRAAKQAGVPVAQTVHNYRFACPNGLFYRDGQVCEDCADKAFPWPAVQHGCYQGSRSSSLAMAVAARSHRSTWALVDRFLCVSEFVAEKLARAGVEGERIIVKYNAVDDPGPPAPLGEGFVFAGRLSDEKGVEHLLEAWSLSGLGTQTTLTIAGDGPLRSAVEVEAARTAGLRYVGQVDREQIGALVRSSRAVVVPSGCFEALPTNVLEAYAAGRPAIVMAGGAAARLVDETVGWTASATANDLSDALRAASVGNAEVRGRAARERYIENFTNEAVIRSTLAIYAALESSNANDRDVRAATA
jgi:glycosyltransferase involved in cell wall biosynthesis